MTQGVPHHHIRELRGSFRPSPAYDPASVGHPHHGNRRCWNWAGALLTKVTAPKTALASLSVTTLDLRYLDLVAEYP